MGIGVLVAHELSNVCYKLFRRWSSQSDQRLSVWPVGPDYDEALIALARYLRRLLPQKREPHSSMFDVEYSDSPAPAWRSPGRPQQSVFCSCSSSFRGNRMVNTNPPSFSARMVPPWASTIYLAMYSPRPVPSPFLLLLA